NSSLVGSSEVVMRHCRSNRLKAPIYGSCCSKCCFASSKVANRTNVLRCKGTSTGGSFPPSHGLATHNSNHKNTQLTTAPSWYLSNSIKIRKLPRQFTIFVVFFESLFSLQSWHVGLGIRGRAFSRTPRFSSCFQFWRCWHTPGSAE